LKPTGPDPKQAGRRVYREMTVALIRDRQDAGSVQVAFSESARFYRLSRQNPKFAHILQLLREAHEKKRAVRVLLDIPEGEVIEDVEPTARP
jgi:uncharacterized protein YjiS (DUF1127 family)